MRKLVEGSGVMVPFSVHQLAAGSGRIGDALAILLPHVFSADELKEPSVKDLDQDKVASLVGMILDLVFSPFSNPFFSCSFMSRKSISPSPPPRTPGLNNQFSADVSV